MIDNLDQKIINSLKHDGRYSCARLAKELGVNVATATKRIDKMLNEDIITIKPVLNPFRLGFNAHAFIALDIDLPKVEQVCTELVNSPNFSLVANSFGRFDMLLIADFPTWEILQDFVAKSLPAFEGVTQIDTFPIVSIKKTYNGLFEYDSCIKSPVSMDKIDYSIIDELGKNGRLSYADIGAKLNISLTTVSRRVTRLQKEGVMRLSAVRNPFKWGYFANAYIAIHADSNKVDAICARLSAYPEAHLVMTVMSGFEILAGIHSPNPEELYKFLVDKAARIDGITNIETFVCAEIKKRAYALFDPKKD
ncbi:MAG: AsnC family transcriptional regulator [Dehalococcoidales bacterium]|nr:AsnC family transcriptional regulator [Dehalococcoidales bacterium]